MFLSRNAHIFQSSLTMFIDYFLHFFFSVLVFWDLNYLDVGPWMSILILFPTPFPIFSSPVFYSLLYLFIYNIIFLILNFYLGCLSLNLQGLILVFGSVCLSYYYHCSFYLVSCACFIAWCCLLFL